MSGYIFKSDVIYVNAFYAVQELGVRQLLPEDINDFCTLLQKEVKKATGRHSYMPGFLGYEDNDKEFLGDPDPFIKSDGSYWFYGEQITKRELQLRNLRYTDPGIDTALEATRIKFAKRITKVEKKAKVRSHTKMGFGKSGFTPRFID